MRQGIAVLLCTFLLALPGAAIEASGQSKSSDKDTNGAAQLISTAQITKIDLKKQTMKVRNIAASMNDGSASSSSGARRSGGGGGFPGGGGMGIPGGRRGGGIGRVPSNGPTNPSNDQLGPEYTVYIGKTTALKEGDHVLNLQDFKVGDHINITGTQKGSGKDMNATVISKAD